MDWTLAIDRNQTALARIVAALFAMVGLVPGGVMERPPNAVRLAVLRILRPAEAAVRRLIVIAAHGLVVKLPPPRATPSGLKTTAKGAGSPRGPRAPAFPLYDSRKRFAGLNGYGKAPRRKPKGPGPRILSFDFAPRVPSVFGNKDVDPRIPSFLRAPPAAPARAPEPPPKAPFSARRLGRRLEAIYLALADIPKQALRLARWRMRRAMMPKAKFQDPLRIGKPPGHRKTPGHEVDDILKEIHALARGLPPLDTS